MTALFYWSLFVAFLSWTTDHQYVCLASLLVAYVAFMSMLGSVMHELGGCEQDY